MQLFEALMVGAGSGLGSAVLMTLFEAYFWRKMGIGGVVEWQINLVMVSQILHEQYNPTRRLKAALGMHLLHGAIFGSFLGAVLSPAERLGTADIFAAAVALGLVLWLVVPFTFRKPFEAPIGARFSNVGIGISLASHLVYGAALAAFLAAAGA